jgi:hypothetical protein
MLERVSVGSSSFTSWGERSDFEGGVRPQDDEIGVGRLWSPIVWTAGGRWVSSQQENKRLAWKYQVNVVTDILETTSVHGKTLVKGIV